MDRWMDVLWMDYNTGWTKPSDGKAGKGTPVEDRTVTQDKRQKM